MARIIASSQYIAGTWNPTWGSWMLHVNTECVGRCVGVNLELVAFFGRSLYQSHVYGVVALLILSEKVPGLYK